MNKKVLKKIKKAILAEPNKFDMDSWFSKGQPWHQVCLTTTKDISMEECGTTACIAGWACHFGDSDQELIMDAAGEILDINIDLSKRLFDVNFWPKNYYDRYCNASSDKERAQVAAGRIDYFMEWSL